MRSDQHKKEFYPPTPNLADAEIGDIKQSGWRAFFFPVDIASVAFFRIAFGLVMLWEVVRYLKGNFIETYWLRPDFLFTFWPFDFVKPLPGDGMVTLYYFLGLVAFCIAIGFLYRLCAIIFFLGMLYSFLLDQSRYLNHVYLICLISFVMIFLPAHRSFAVDTKLFKKWRSDVIPAWPVWLLRFMVALPCFFGGIAKINGDWLRGEPLGIWLASDTDFPVIGPYFTEDWMIYIMSYSGLLFDLAIIPCLLFKRTRIWAFLFMILFNIMNAKLFNIGIFPLLMIGATTIFFNPSWPRNMMQVLNFSKKQKSLVIAEDWNPSFASGAKRKMLLTVLGLWVTIHFMVPLRHFFIPGSVHWTEEGHNFAWHMKLRTKKAKADIRVEDKQTGEREKIIVSNYLTSWQEKRMPSNPDMLWQFCHMLKSEYAEQGRDVTVHADIKVSLNGRRYQQMISPDIDITSVPRPIFGHSSWIIPLKTPLKSRLDEAKEGEE